MAGSRTLKLSILADVADLKKNLEIACATYTQIELIKLIKIQQDLIKGIIASKA